MTIRVASGYLKIQFSITRVNIDIRYHFLRDCVQRGTIQLEYIQKDEQVAHIFTKALCRQSLVKCGIKLGFLPNLILVEMDC